MTRRRSVTRVLVIAGALGAAGLLAFAVTPLLRPAAEDSAARLEWRDCWFEPGDDWPDADCGVLRVPERRDAPDGGTVSLPFIVFRALEPGGNEPPVVVTGGGGPGGPLGIDPEGPDEIDDSLWLANYYMSVDSGRDLILLDNRGVGSARPRLACPGMVDLDLDLLGRLLSLEETVEAGAAAYRTCAARLRDEGVDLGAYNNLAAARDIDDLRAALGLKRISLYGISYGTRIALTYLRAFPEAVQAMVLDGVEGPEVDFYEASPKEDAASLRRVFELCRADVSCRERYGADLLPRFLRYLEELAAEPLSLRVTDPRNDGEIDIWLTPDLLLSAMFGAIYDEALVVEVPRAVWELMAGRSAYAVKHLIDGYVEELALYPLDQGAYASYQCHDEAPFNDFAAARREAAAYPLAHYMEPSWVRLEQAMCEAWGVASDAVAEGEPVRSEVPVLLYTGAWDPATPVSWARSAARHLPHSFSRVWPGIGHGVLAVSECADLVAAAFLTDPWTDPFGQDCLAEETESAPEFD